MTENGERIPILADPLPEPFLELLADRYQVLPWNDPPDENVLQRARAVVAYGHPTIDAALMERMPNLAVVSNHGVGVDHVDVAAAEERGVPVGNTPGCLDASTADMAMALLLSVARNVVVGDRYARSPEFVHFDPSILIGHEVGGTTLGIVGMGRVGTQVARRARGFDMPVLYCNRNRRPEAEQELGVRYAPLDELLAESDYVVLTCPLTDETRGLISGPQLAQMKPTAILVNVARGPVVDMDALHAALVDRTIAAAALDVTDPEPLPRDHALLGLENLVITPHLGSASDRTRRRMMEMTVENLDAGIEGRDLPWRVRPA